MYRVTMALLLALLSRPNGALADAAGAAACAASLPPKARLIYDAVAPGLKPGDVLRDAIKSHTISLVMNGKLTRGEARPAAMSAAGCLKQLK